MGWGALHPTAQDRAQEHELLHIVSGMNDINLAKLFSFPGSMTREEASGNVQAFLANDCKKP